MRVVSLTTLTIQAAVSYRSTINGVNGWFVINSIELPGSGTFVL